jgi:thymidylate synthase
MRFNKAQEAFEFFYNKITQEGNKLDNTMFLQNVGFYIDNPLNNQINTSFRKWKNSYADLEWEWYLSKNRDVSEIKKHAKIWDKMHNGDNLVNSNYGYQWSRSNQLDFVIDELTKNPNSRRAVLSIYDGKEHEKHSLDTPCTLNIVFNITDTRLNMTVLMRSNDLWYGFCNDQYCFSKLQELVSLKLALKVGWYYHFVNNLHLYEQHLTASVKQTANFLKT